MLRNLSVFILAGLAEIGGGYLVWQWLKLGKPFWCGIAGSLILVLYGVIATWQPAGFSKVYATYGGVFVVLSLVWGYVFDQAIPSFSESVGASIILVGVLVMLSDF